MTLLTPYWLVLAVPWAVACLWAGRAALPAAGVPFLPLWPPARPTAGPRRRRPPLWAILLLGAALLAIVAAASPVLSRMPVARPRPATRPVVNAGIDHFAVVAGSHPQAMVSVFNGTERGHAVLSVDGVRELVDLPPPGRTRDYFLDLPGFGATAEARLLTDAGGPWVDDVAADDRMTLTRSTMAVRIDPRTPLSPALSRFAAIYERHRTEGAATAGRAGVAVVRGEPPAGACVILADALGQSMGQAAVGVDAGHPISRSLVPATLNALGRATAAPPGDGWRSLVSDDGRVLLAVRERPARQVWVGFDVDALADSPAFVAFWADVFDWLGGGEPAWIAPPAVRVNTPVPATQADTEPRPVPLSPGLLTAALALIAAGGWVRRGLTGF